jgi:hypothetical protein
MGQKLRRKVLLKSVMGERQNASLAFRNNAASLN